jgi:peptide/nickel transport system permease protein
MRDAAHPRRSRTRPDYLLWTAAVVLGLLVALAWCAPLLAPHDPVRQSLVLRLKPPGFTGNGLTFLLGSDELGRDVLSRLLHGLRNSLIIAVFSSVLAAAIGSALGIAAGWAKGWLDMLIMRTADAVLSIPTLVLAVFVIAIVGPGMMSLIGLLALARWPRHARLARAETLRLAQKPFVLASHLAGASTPRLLIRHILPNAAPPLIVLFASELSLMVLFEAALTFLGLGIQPPEAAIGAMLSSGRTYIERAWWLVACPGVVLLCLTMALNLMADRLRHRHNPSTLQP